LGIQPGIAAAWVEKIEAGINDRLDRANGQRGFDKVACSVAAQAIILQPG